MLSKDCYGCSDVRKCRIRFANVTKGEFVYCADGSRHLVDIQEEWLVH
jgi:hypothetical protein